MKRARASWIMSLLFRSLHPPSLLPVYNTRYLSISKIRIKRYHSTNENRAVKLDYEVYNPPSTTSKGPLLILHGLLYVPSHPIPSHPSHPYSYQTPSGSKQNWRSLSKLLSNALNRKIYTIDLRNHGSSPHARPHTYSAMADDVRMFIKNEGLGGVSLLGHSM